MPERFYYVLNHCCLKCQRLKTVNQSCSWTMKNEVKDVNSFEIYSSVWKPKLA